MKINEEEEEDEDEVEPAEQDKYLKEIRRTPLCTEPGKETYRIEYHNGDVYEGIPALLSSRGIIKQYEGGVRDILLLKWGKV